MIGIWLNPFSSNPARIAWTNPSIILDGAISAPALAWDTAVLQADPMIHHSEHLRRYVRPLPRYAPYRSARDP